MKSKYGQFQGKKGRSGRKSHGVEKAYLDAIDRAIPQAVEFCELLIKEAIEMRNCFPKDSKNPLEIKSYWDVFKIKNDLAVKAATTLIGKAPQRVEGGGDKGEILIKVVSDI